MKRHSELNKTYMDFSEEEPVKGILFRDRLLTFSSKFHDIAQYAIETHYLKPYPKQIIDGKIKRPLHGGLHVSLTALLIRFFYQLYSDTLPHFLNETFSPELEKLLFLSAIYHDSGNDQEVFHEEEKHAEIFRKDMKNLGFLFGDIERVAQAIEKKEDVNNKDIIRFLLHDADCFEILRTLKDPHDFEAKKLCIYQVFKEHLLSNDFYKFKIKLNVIVEWYHQIILIMRQKQLHEHCELAENCYKETSIIFSKLITLFLFKRLGYLINIDTETILTQFNCIASNNKIIHPGLLLAENWDRESIMKYLFMVLNKSNDDFLPDLSVQIKFVNHGLYLRRLVPTDLNKQSNQRIRKEIAISQANAKILQKIASDTILIGKKIQGMKFRPATYIRQSLPIECYNADAVGLLFDVKEKDPNFKTFNFYKININSNDIENPEFELKTTPNKVKNLMSLDALIHKLEELNERRCGTMEDKHNRYFGRLTLPRNEVHLTYLLEHAVAIVIGRTYHSILDALFLKFYFNDPNVPIHYYSPISGLHHLDLDNEEIQNLLLDTNHYLANLARFDSKYLLIREIQPRNSLLPYFEKYTFETIKRENDDKPISALHPLRYKFTFSNSPDLNLLGYVKKGIPIVESKDGVFLPSFANNLLRLANECYLSMQVRSTEKLFKTLALKSNIVQNVNFSTKKFELIFSNQNGVVYEKREKNVLVIKSSVRQFLNLMKTFEKLNIFLVKPNHFKIVKEGRHTKTFITSRLQSIQPFFQVGTQLLQRIPVTYNPNEELLFSQIQVYTNPKKGKFEMQLNEAIVKIQRLKANSKLVTNNKGFYLLGCLSVIMLLPFLFSSDRSLRDFIAISAIIFFNLKLFLNTYQLTQKSAGKAKLTSTLGENLQITFFKPKNEEMQTKGTSKNIFRLR